MIMPLQRHTAGNLSILVGSGGEPFVLLHGIPGSVFSWEHAGESLVKQRQVIIPDLAGFGQSNSPRGGYYFTTFQ